MAKNTYIITKNDGFMSTKQTNRRKAIALARYICEYGWIGQRVDVYLLREFCDYRIASFVRNGPANKATRVQS